MRASSLLERKRGLAFPASILARRGMGVSFRSASSADAARSLMARRGGSEYASPVQTSQCYSSSTPS